VDTLTHALFGAVTGRGVKSDSRPVDRRQSDRALILVCTFAAAFPDLDYLLFPLDPLLFLSEWHRAYTHSLVLLPFWAVVIAGFVMIFFHDLRKHPVKLWCFAGLGITSHILLDLLTVYGTKIFFPLSSQSFSLGTTFVIDPILTMLIVTGLILSFYWRPRIIMVITFVAMVAYIAFQWHLKIAAKEIADKRFEQGNTIALPQPFSPFHWRIIHQTDHRYLTALVDMAGLSHHLQRWEKDLPQLDTVTAYQAVKVSQWKRFSLLGDTPRETSLAKTVWQHDKMAKFRVFAKYPILYRIEQRDHETCVWFSDLRYHISIITPSFRYGMCREEDSQEWQRYRLKYFSEERH